MRRVIQIIVSSCILVLAATTGGVAADQDGVDIHLNGPANIIYCSAPKNAEEEELCNACPSTQIDCPESEGFFQMPSSDQCFKVFADEQLDWEEAGSFCKDAGLVLAEPNPDIAPVMQQYLNDTFGDMNYNFWVNGRSDGRKVTWQRSGLEESPNSGLWEPRDITREVRGKFCMTLTVGQWPMEQRPGRPYDMMECSARYVTYPKPICERIN